MKCIAVIILSLLSYLSHAQIQKENIVITYNKNTYLFFPGLIDFVDVGSEDILAKFENNMVVISSAIDYHEQTSLFVTTENKGRFFFLVSYNAEPAQFIYNYEDVIIADPVTTEETIKNDIEINSDSLYILNQFNKITEDSKERVIESIDVISKDETRVFDIGISKKKLMFKARGVYYDGDYIYLSLELFNYSQIDYEMDFVKFFMINNRGAGKKTFQEDELLPVVTYKPFTIAAPDQGINVIYGFKKFTMTDKKLKVDIWEHRGDRRLEITISENDILKAKTISELN